MRGQCRNVYTMLQCGVRWHDFYIWTVWHVCILRTEFATVAVIEKVRHQLVCGNEQCLNRYWTNSLTSSVFFYPHDTWTSSCVRGLSVNKGRKKRWYGGWRWLIHKDNVVQKSRRWRTKSRIDLKSAKVMLKLDDYHLTQCRKAIDISKKPRASHKLTVIFQCPISIWFLHDAPWFAQHF